jgi:hypothetical protein
MMWAMPASASCQLVQATAHRDHEIYTRAQPRYTGRVTVPVLWDEATDTIVNNESSEIIWMFNSAFDTCGAAPGDFCPKELRRDRRLEHRGCLIRFRSFGPIYPAREGFFVACNLPQRFPFKLFRHLSVSTNLHGATIEEGTTFNGERLVVNIANDMGLRLKNDLPALNRTFDFPVHNHALGCDGSGHMSPRGDDEGSAVKFAINLSIDLH